MIFPYKMHNMFLLQKAEWKRGTGPGSPLFLPFLWVSEVFGLFCIMASTLGRSSEG